MFEANLNVHFFDSIGEDEFIEKEDKYFDFNYKDTYKMFVTFYKYNEDKPPIENTYFIYEIIIPVNLCDNHKLYLEFLPDGIFKLQDLLFNSNWHFFIEDIKGENDCYYKTHSEFIEQIIKIRHCYSNILTKFYRTRVIIWTDANYFTEEEFIHEHAIGRENKLGDNY